ncbi:MAG: hypothetical protein MPN21_11545 [Thermoanaerobaculia bacterium]|nr:hypothetical protein [Thermoanaerobaculia bacterium]
MKFRRLDYLAEPLADLAAPSIRNLVSSAGGIDSVVPVPLHWRRRFHRGYDQAALLASALARRLERPVSNVLRRVRATPAQSLHDRSQRRRNLAGAFLVRTRAQALVRGRKILLVDDVITTGATMEEAARELRRSGALAVQPFAIAWTPDEEEGDENPEEVDNRCV